MPTTGRVHGVVLDSRRKPICDATVLIEEGEGDHPDIATLSNERGEFTLAELPTGAYRIVAFSPTGAKASADVLIAAPDKSEVTLMIVE